MGLLARIFGAVSRKQTNGISLDRKHLYWELSGKTDFSSLLTALIDLLPRDSVLYFEGGSPSGELLEFLNLHKIPERAHVAYGTIWPRPLVIHIPATSEVMVRLSELMCSRGCWELAIHFHVYSNRSILLEWYDAFTTQSMCLSAELPEQKVRRFAERLGMSSKRSAEK